MQNKLMIALLGFTMGFVLSLFVAYKSMTHILVNSGYISTSSGNYYVISEEEIEDDRMYKSFLNKELNKSHAEVNYLNSVINEIKHETTDLTPPKQ